MNDAIHAKVREAILSVILERLPDIHSPYAINGHPPMWSILENEGRTLALRPAGVTHRIGPYMETVDGAVIGWHRAGTWTSDQHMAIAWANMIDSHILPALAAGAVMRDDVPLDLSDADSAEIRARRLAALDPIEASAISDDYAIQVLIDPRHYLARASEEQLVELRQGRWRGGLAADRVWEVALAHGCSAAAELEAYLKTSPKMPNGDDVGFEVICDEDVMLGWLERQRPDMHQSLLAVQFVAEHGMPGETELDDMVHDAAESIASYVNNRGSDGQRAFLNDRAAASDLAEEDLDDAVSDAASAIASDINNDGPEAQLKFLIGQGFRLKDIAASLSNKGPAP